jgi:hypothetical protein
LPRPSKARPLIAAEVAHARQRNVHQTIEELEHLRAAQRDLAAHRPAFAQLERATETRALVATGFWPAILAISAIGVFQHLLVADRLAHAHVERDLGDLRHLHRLV